MSEIKVGEYVRTFNGLIGKVNCIELAGRGTRYAGEFITDTIIQFDDGRVYERRVREKNITKHSKNIIDLIEPGDIVNNHYVKAVYLDGAVKYIKLDNAYSPENHFTGVRTYEDDIETILTKEQMEANQYVVKRNMETN